MAVFGVLNPRPTSLYHLRPFLPARADLTLTLELRKICGCFWKARSAWTVNSVAIFAVGGCRDGRKSWEIGFKLVVVEFPRYTDLAVEKRLGLTQRKTLGSIYLAVACVGRYDVAEALRHVIKDDDKMEEDKIFCAALSS